MSSIVIGKYALESLTAGMYDDPFVVFREYIQNAVDSIDNAIKHGYIKQGEELVTVGLFPLEERIEITDNGLGIAAKDCENVLTGIGNSTKDISISRGFRGIGRLASLSYCKRLIFETSYPGENITTRVIFDASRLNDILMHRTENSEITMEDVVANICSSEQSFAQPAAHYFKVIMEEVAGDTELLKMQLVKEYLEQVAPVPFNQKEFKWGDEIVNRLQQRGYGIPQYKINIVCNTECIQVMKPYRDSFLFDKAHNISDSILDIEIYEILNVENELTAIAWIAHSNYMGTVVDRNVKGLRIRKGNLLIGDNQTMNTAFKDSRFNGWVIGEVYIIESRLLPNARRDNFEKNPSYFLFFEKMTILASNIIKKIREASLKRNSQLQDAIGKAESIAVVTNIALDQQRISAQSKGSVVQKLNNVQKSVAEISTNTISESLIREIAFDELDMLIGKVKGATEYRAINLISSLGKTEKKVLEKVFRAIQEQLSQEETQRVSDIILKAFI